MSIMSGYNVTKIVNNGVKCPDFDNLRVKNIFAPKIYINNPLNYFNPQFGQLNPVCT